MLIFIQLFAVPWTVACQAPLSVGFSRQEYWSGLPFPPGDLPDPGIKPPSPASLTLPADSVLPGHLGSLEISYEWSHMICGLCVWFLPFSILFSSFVASLVAQRLKRLPAVQETQVPSLGREDPLEKEMAPDFNTLAWKIPWMEEPGGLQSTGVPKSWTQLSDFTFTFQASSSM